MTGASALIPDDITATTDARGGQFDVAAARVVLRALAGHAPLPAVRPPVAATADWLVQHDLMGIAWRRLAADWPALATALRPFALDQLGANSVLFDELAALAAVLAPADVPLVLLKGAALAIGTYAALVERPMTDIDIWVRAADMNAVCAALAVRGFVQHSKASRPPALNRLSDGELQFWSPRWRLGLIELHWSPFSGWWLKRTAAVDGAALWARTQPLPGYAPHVRRLATSDQILQAAVHNGINHQFGRHAVRHLLDVALLAQQAAIDWPALVATARDWRLATVTWATLALTDDLIGLPPAAQAAIAALAPPAWRRRRLLRMITPQALVAGLDVRGSRRRYLLLLLLVDRPRDALRLLGRTLWPERDWLTARYGEGASYWRHLQQLRSGQL